jgi:tetratricopeptide (TPR) repeat protein
MPTKPALAAQSNQRDRGRLLTPEALAKLKQAIRDWESANNVRCTQERIRELTTPYKDGGLDPGTISKILKAREKVDLDSIDCLFKTFGLQLQEADLIASALIQRQFDPGFMGREEAIADLEALIQQGATVIVVQAKGGMGKTTLARRFLQQKFDSVLEFPIAQETKDIASIESLIEEKLRQLGEEPGQEFLVSLDRLKRKLQTNRIGILIDNLEPALDPEGKFIAEHRRYFELLRVLVDSTLQSITLITSRERLHEPNITVKSYTLKKLDLQVWKQFFSLNHISVQSAAIAVLHNRYGGNAKAMEILRSAISEDYSGNIDEYWQENQDELFIEQDLEDLVANQFNRLQQSAPDAYKLLCRMGCYRYQEVPRVSRDGLISLLWDVPEKDKKKVINALKDRSLMEYEEGEFWLHPMIRAEAIDRLRGSEDDLQMANQEAARFWTASVRSISKITDALKAFEAYYHYVELNDPRAASTVILERRKINQSMQSLSLGSSFYRLGLMHQIILGINRIINDIPSASIRSQLYTTLANANWIVGNIQEGIRYQEYSIMSFHQAVNEQEELVPHVHRFRRELYSLLSIGLYKIDLWDLREAYNVFQQIIEQADSHGLDGLAAKARCHLAFVSSCIDLRPEAEQLVEQATLATQTAMQAEQTLVDTFNYHEIALGLACKTLGQFQNAFTIYRSILSRLGEGERTEIKAKVLGGQAELYREQKNFDTAMALHDEAINLFKQINAKPALAEAYYQLALTYQAMGNVEGSSDAFQLAMRLFSEMEAPKQVERVRRSMAMSQIE